MTPWLTAVLLVAPDLATQVPASSELPPIAEAQPRDPASAPLDEERSAARRPMRMAVEEDERAVETGHADAREGDPLGVGASALAGCVAGSALPAVGLGAGAALLGGTLWFYGQDPDASANWPAYLVFGVLLPVIFAYPAAVAFGSCTAVGASLAGGAAAVICSSPSLFLPTALAALPGVLLGVAGGLLLVGATHAGPLLWDVVGPGRASDQAEAALGVTGAVLSLLAGPASVAGMATVQLVLDSDDQGDDDDDGRARATPRLNQHTFDGAPVLVMAY